MVFGCITLYSDSTTFYQTGINQTPIPRNSEVNPKRKLQFAQGAFGVMNESTESEGIIHDTILSDEKSVNITCK